MSACGDGSHPSGCPSLYITEVWSGKSTMSAIADLSAWVKDSLSKPKCPLYTIYRIRPN